MNRLEDINLPKEESEGAVGVAEVSRENIDKREDDPEQIEAKALEREPASKLKKAFLVLTSILVLASGAEAYAQQKAEYLSGVQSEISATTMTLEKVEKSSEFRKALVESGIKSEDAKELIDFVNAKGVPIEDLEATSRNMDEKSDKLMLLKTYAVVYEAVKYNFLDQKHAASFEKWILTGLKNGDIGVVKENQKMPIWRASYDSESDSYSIDDIKLGDVNDKASMIHELTHACQDAEQLPKKIDDCEWEASMVENEYKLRQSGLIEQDKEGNYKIAEMNLNNVANAYQQIIIIEKAMHNALNGRNDLNDGLIIEGEKISEMSKKKSESDVEAFLKTVKEDHEANLKSVLRIIISFTHGEKQFMLSDGFNKANKKNGE